MASPTAYASTAWSHLRDERTNRGLAFTQDQRADLGLRGLLPAAVREPDQQIELVVERVRACGSDLAKYVYLNSLRERDRDLFYAAVIRHIDEYLPLIYTPTVGEACQNYGRIWEQPQGLYITADDIDRIPGLLAHWRSDDIRAIVVTDGERILGLGDLGAHGMGIPVGKLSLYTACAGLHPDQCLPVTLDVGCDDEALRQDPHYLGLRQPRLKDEDYEQLLDAFMHAVTDRYDDCLVQFEDFATENARTLLARHRRSACVFNDDIQGTAAVTLAGLLAALRETDQPITEQKLLMLGAGEAGVGIADLMVVALMAEGLEEHEAREHCWLFDSSGLIVADRDDLNDANCRYAHEADAVDDFAQAVEQLEPTAIIGASGQGGMFDEQVVKAMAEHNERPIIFALSNPTDQAECTAEQAYEWTQGKALFAAGSPFDAVDYNGQRFEPGQANNAYVFPGIGLGLVAAHARQVPDQVFYIAARTLAQQVQTSDLDVGRLYPPLSDIRNVSAKLAAAVAEHVHEAGLSMQPRPRDFDQLIAEHVYHPYE